MPPKTWSQLAQGHSTAGIANGDNETKKRLLEQAPLLPSSHPSTAASSVSNKSGAWQKPVSGPSMNHTRPMLENSPELPLEARQNAPVQVPAPLTPAQLPVASSAPYLPRLCPSTDRDPLAEILGDAEVQRPQVQSRPEEHNQTLVWVSKLLSRILRHHAVDEGLPITVNGYVPLDALLRHPKFRGVKRSDIAQVVRDNAKQRFLMVCDADGTVFIRANQGHSMPGISVDMHKVTEPHECPVAYHGTKMRLWPSIAASGLSCMKRQHVHMSRAAPGSRADIISGARASSDCIIAVDIARMVADGIEVLISSNDVVLTAGINGIIPTTYFKSVRDAAGREIWHAPL